MKIDSELISIIVPVYNVEKYLRKCLNSIIAQTYENLEIICIDDGSPDNSIDILNEFIKKDKRIKIIRQKNQGLSGARNTGISNATGKYITFVDSDDWLKKDYCKFLYDNLKKYDADLIALPMCSFYETGKIISESTRNDIKIFDSSEAIKNMFSRNGISWCAPSKLYKKELFNSIRFPLRMLMEDKATLYKIYDKCKKIVFINNSKYMYLIRKGSIMRSNFSEKRMKAFDIQIAINEFIEKKYPKNITIANAYTVRISLIYLCEISASNYENIEKSEMFFTYIEKYKEDFFRCKAIDYRFKILYFLIKMLRKIYKKNIYYKYLYKYLCLKVVKKQNRV